MTETHYQVFYKRADHPDDESSHVAEFSTEEAAKIFRDSWNDAHPDGSAHDLQEFDGPVVR